MEINTIQNLFDINTYMFIVYVDALIHNNFFEMLILTPKVW